MPDIMCSSEAYHEKRVRDFIEYGEKPAPYRTLIASDRTEINDGSVERPIGLGARIPPFKGCPVEMEGNL